MRLHFLLNTIFRSNPIYELKELSTLNQSELTALAGSLTDDPEIFGVFVPKYTGAVLNFKLAYKDVALLFYLLQQPGKLPAYIKNIYDDDLNTIIAKLVMEDVLQIESNGDFVSGVNAFKLLYKNVNREQLSAFKHIEDVSQKAIGYVLKLNNIDLNSAHTRLYCYNTTLPCFDEPALQTVEQVQRFLGILTDDVLAKELAQHWDMYLPTEKYKWLMFSRRQGDYRISKNDFTYKIYVSPLIRHLPQVYKKTVETLTLTKAFSFKTGINQSSLLRPDKFVIYFHEYNDLTEAAALLKDALKEFPAQGVPFTAQLDDTGLLSWGIDPPQNDLPDSHVTSWRAQITEKLAIAILQAKAANFTKDDAYHYVMNKIFLERIDPFTWMPKQNINN